MNLLRYYRLVPLYYTEIAYVVSPMPVPAEQTSKLLALL
jgi:hypothetical protein